MPPEQKLYVFGGEKYNKKWPENIVWKKYPKNKKMFLVSPHSDDISISCGGAVSTLSEHNKVTPFLYFSGWRGVSESNKQKAVRKREAEMQKEAKVLGIKDPIFLRLSSYDKQSEQSFKRDIEVLTKEIERYAPDIIFLPKKNDDHPRHRLATQMTLKALNKTNIKKPVLFFYENPWSLFSAYEFNAVFILSDKASKNKIKAVRQHKSQLKRTDFDTASLALDRLRGAVVPEQRMFGYGNQEARINHLNIEAFICE